MLTVAIVDTLGLCYDGSTLTKRGLGGSESAVILMSRELSKLGFDTYVFNDCTSDDASPGIYDNVKYEPLSNIENYKRFDVFIASRSVVSFAPNEIKERFKWSSELPNLERVALASRHRVLWMHDTFCDGDDLIEDFVLQGRIHEIFTLSDWHTSYVTNCDHGKRRNYEILKRHVFQTRNGIQLYHDFVDVSKKDPNLFVYNASVTKGMIPLVEKVWPLVKEKLPDARLKVIGGYYRFRTSHGPDEQELRWREMVDDPTHAFNDIEFTGIISQKEIADILAESSFMIYPSAFPETFGISTLESLAYNTPLITCKFGALEETAIDLACYKIPYPVEKNWSLPWLNEDEQCRIFADAVIKAYNTPYLHQQKMYACNQVKDICTWDTVALQWKQHFYKLLGEFLPIEEYHRVTDINNRVHKVFGRRYHNYEESSVRKQTEKSIVIITTVYNAENYIDKCIRSVAAQDYDNYRMIIINDASTDRTAEVIENTIAETGLENGEERDDIRRIFEVITRDQNVGAVCNQISTIKSRCYSDDIVMILDGDDWLVNNPNIFNMYNNMYHEGAEYTYGSCWSLVDNIPLIAQPYPPEVKANKSYRDHKFNWNFPYPHLRTFVGRLALNLDESLFKDAYGEWYRAGGDVATFYNIIEQADPDKIVCVSDIVYMYNDTNPINDYKVNGDQQTDTANFILKKSEKTMKKILIAIPTAKYIEPETMKSIYDLEVPEGYETEFQFFYGYNIDQVRNLIAHWVVNGYDYLFSVDSDIIFETDTLKKMLAHDVDYVSGIYRQRLPTQTLEVYDLSQKNIPIENIPDKSLIEIGGSGFGCVLVKREVFLSVGYPYFVYHSALNHADTFSEDMDFCKKAREKGHKLHCDTTIICGHKGTSVYEVTRN